MRLDKRVHQTGDMHRVTIFRILLVLFVFCYVAAFHFKDIDYAHTSSALRAYQERLETQFDEFRDDVQRGISLWLAGHLIEVVGLVLLFCRVHLGLWPACLGAALAACASWYISLPDFYPNLQTTTHGLLWSATCILWGGYVCMALCDQGNIFPPATKS